MANLSLCTDDLSSRDLYESGHLDRLVSRLVQSKVPLFRALRLVTRNPAVYFNLSDRNAPAPGRKADLVVFDNPEEMRVRATVKDGKVVYREGEDIGAGRGDAAGSGLVSRTQCGAFPQGRPAKKATGKRMRAIGVSEGTIITDDLTVDARTENGYLVCRPREGPRFCLRVRPVQGGCGLRVLHGARIRA